MSNFECAVCKATISDDMEAHQSKRGLVCTTCHKSAKRWGRLPGKLTLRQIEVYEILLDYHKGSGGGLSSTEWARMAGVPHESFTRRIKKLMEAELVVQGQFRRYYPAGAEIEWLHDTQSPTSIQD